MHRLNPPLGPIAPLSSVQRALKGALAIGLVCLAACGSDAKTSDNAATDSNTTGGANPAVVNSDKVSTDPTTAPLSSGFKGVNGATTIELPYVLFSANPNATNPVRAYSIAANSYDTCTFGFRHGYKNFPSGTFDFVGFYLVNGTPGAPLAKGEYTAGATTGMYIDTKESGAGLGVSACKGASYTTVQSGSVTITTLGTGTGGTQGSANVVMSDGTVFSGDFGTGACVGGSGPAPTQPTPDPYACTKIN